LGNETEPQNAPLYLNPNVEWLCPPQANAYGYCT